MGFLNVQAPGRDDDWHVVPKPVVGRRGLCARLHGVDVDRVVDNINPVSAPPSVGGKVAGHACGDGNDAVCAAEGVVGGTDLQASAQPLGVGSGEWGMDGRAQGRDALPPGLHPGCRPIGGHRGAKQCRHQHVGLSAAERPH